MVGLVGVYNIYKLHLTLKQEAGEGVREKEEEKEEGGGRGVYNRPIYKLHVASKLKKKERKEKEKNKKRGRRRKRRMYKHRMNIII